MAFIWNPDTNSTAPPPILPIPVGDGEMSFEQKEVANSVNIHPIYGAGTLLWNIATPPDEGDNGLYGDFDIVYQLPSLNVLDIHATHLESDNVTVYLTATINTASIGVATINTANIVSATIANGYMGVNPTANLQIATKEYVDALAANSIPLGGNLQLLIQAAGDLLVGVSDNTAERLPVGTDGRVLVAGGSSNVGVYWSTGPRGSLSTHRGLYIGTSLSASLSNSIIEIVAVDEIVMDDGFRTTTGWIGKRANILSNVATSGVGYLDTGVVRAQTAYEVWAVRNSSNGDQALILHRATERFVDVSHRPAAAITNFRKVNYALGTGLQTTINVAQSFIATNTGPFTSIEFALTRTGTPVGNCWVTLEANVAGSPSGIPLATSRYMDASKMPADLSAGRIRFVFDTTANVVSGTSYWGVFQTDYLRASSVNENHLSMWGTTSNQDRYTNGTAKQFSANSNTWLSANTSSLTVSDFYIRTFVESFNTELLLPSGYDQKCLLSYAATAPGNLDGIESTPVLCIYQQRGTKMSMNFHRYWNIQYNGALGGGTPDDAATGFLECLDLRHFVPPVPCLVTFQIACFVNGDLLTCVGHLSSTDMGPVSGGSGLSVIVESDGSLQVNTAPTSLMVLGPILAEHQTVAVRTHTGTTTFYLSGVEY